MNQWGRALYSVERTHCMLQLSLWQNIKFYTGEHADPYKWWKLQYARVIHTGTIWP